MLLGICRSTAYLIFIRMCIAPFAVKQVRLHSEYFQNVPCGRCPECVQARQRDWLFRFYEEIKLGGTAFFVTLTYDESNVVHCDNGLSLAKCDVQNFCKRIRYYEKKEGREDFKYYMVGEYGKKGRPHYHGLLFKISEDSIYDSWDLGFVDIGTVSGASMRYVLKYMDKSKLGAWFNAQEVLKDHMSDEPTFENDFSLSSRGIGDDFLTDTVKYRMTDGSLYEMPLPWGKGDGSRMLIPRYYYRRLFGEDAAWYYRQPIIERNKVLKEERYIAEAAKWGGFENAAKMKGLSRQVKVLKMEKSVRDQRNAL